MNIIDTLNWMRSFQINPLTLNHEMLPSSITWKLLCQHLVGLSKTKHVTYSRQGSFAFQVTIAETSEQHGWSPSKNLYSKLKQYGYPSPKINNLLARYNSNQYPREDREFLNFCLDQAPLALEMLFVPVDWHPSTDTIQQLIGSHDQTTIQFFLDEFRHIYSYKPAYIPSFDKLFLRFIDVDHHRLDIKIPPNWKPDKETVSELIALLRKRNTLNSDSILEMCIGEYRMYWSEMAARRTDWNSHFRRWAKHNLPSAA